MRKYVFVAAMLAGLSSLSGNPALAQDNAGAVSLSNLSAPDYVKLAADSDNFEVQSGRLAAQRSRREDVRGFSKQLVADHTALGKSLIAALSNQDRKIAAPSTRLSAQNQAKLDLLRKAPKATFDQIYLQQQVETHQSILALQQTYADDGTDASLRQVATAAVPIVSRHAAALTGLTGGAM